MYCVSSATENIVMEASQNILIYTYSAALAYNAISIMIMIMIMIYSETPGLKIYSKALPQS